MLPSMPNLDLFSQLRLEHEARLRSDLDGELARLRKDVDDATMVRVDLERKIETLGEELQYGKKLHEEVIMILCTKFLSLKIYKRTRAYEKTFWLFVV